MRPRPWPQWVLAWTLTAPFHLPRASSVSSSPQALFLLSRKLRFLFLGRAPSGERGTIRRAPAKPRSVERVLEHRPSPELRPCPQVYGLTGAPPFAGLLLSVRIEEEEEDEQKKLRNMRWVTDRYVGLADRYFSKKNDNCATKRL